MGPYRYKQAMAAYKSAKFMQKALVGAKKGVIKYNASKRKRAPAKQTRTSKRRKTGRNEVNRRVQRPAGYERISAGNHLVSTSRCISYRKPTKTSKLYKLLGPTDTDRSISSGFIRKPELREQTSKICDDVMTNADIVALYNRSISTNVNYRDIKTITEFAQDYFMEVLRWSNTYTFVNQMPGMVKIEIFDCRAKKANATSTLAHWIQGLSRAGGIDAAQELITFPGSQPTDSTYFNSNWAVMKKTSIYLNTGGTHMHTIDRHVNKKFSLMEVNGKQAIGEQLIASNTWSTFITVNGFPVDNEPNTTVDPLVTTDAAKVVWTNNQHITTRLYRTKSRHIEYNNLLPLDNTVANAYGQNVDGIGIHDSKVNVVTSTVANG